MKYSKELAEMVSIFVSSSWITNPQDIPKQLELMMEKHPLTEEYKELFRRLVSLGYQLYVDNKVRGNPFLQLSEEEMHGLKFPKFGKV